MIKMPIQLLRDDFFEITRVVTVPLQSSLQIVDFSEHMTAEEPSWIIALRSPKLIKLINFPFAALAENPD